MTVPNQYAHPATVVEVIELNSPPQPILDPAQSRRVGNVLKIVGPTIEVESWRVVAEVCFHDALVAIVGVVGGRQSHARLHSPFFVVSHSYRPADVGERSIMVVVVKDVRGGIACQINIRPAITIEVG